MHKEADPTITTALWAMDFSKRQLEGYLAGFEGDAWIAQPCSGANHALWQIGHLAMAYNFFASKFGEVEPLGEEWNTLFGMGSEPKPELGAYAAPAEVLEVMWRERQTLIDNMASLDADKRDTEWETESPIKTPAHMMAFVPIHDATHAGQIAMIRKHLGMERVFG